MTENRLFYKRVARDFLLLLTALLLCRFSRGMAAFGIAALGGIAALRRNTARAFACLATLFLLVLLNPFLFSSKASFLGYAIRGGSFFIMCSIALSAGHLTKWKQLPLKGLFAYMAVCVVSSSTGWVPLISYLKLLMFGAFLVALIAGASSLQSSAEEMWSLRSFLMALTVFIVMGSLVLWPFPQWSSLGAVVFMKRSGGDFWLVESMLADGMYFNQALLCGVFSHSQTLAVVSGCCFAYIVADMLFIEKRVDFLHVALLFSAIFVMYQTKSRSALVTIVTVISFAVWMLGRRINMPFFDLNKVRKIVLQGLLLALVIGAAVEIRNGMITRWLRKKGNVSEDERTMVEAVTESRQGLIAKSMRDFYLNPVFGMGFQVEERHRYSIKGYSGHGLILSASVEKGLLPLVVLGESGVVGSIVFILFLINFYSTCAREGLMATSMLFTVLLSANMGEATFFSSGGPGGTQWLLTVIGGYVVDMICFSQQQHIQNPLGQIYSHCQV